MLWTVLNIANVLAKGVPCSFLLVGSCLNQ
jgi:hypothetical protein